DIKRPGKISSLLAGVRYVIHAAARMPQRTDIDDPGAAMESMNFTLNLLRILPPAVRQIIYCSSVDVYGLNSKVAVSESCLTQPATAYGIAKLFGEHLVRIRFQKKAVVTSLRFSHLYGPGEPRIKIIPRLIHCIASGGRIQIENQGQDSRDYLFIEDAAEAVIACLDKPPSGVFNVSGAKKTAIRTVIKILEEISGKKMKVRYLPVRGLSHSFFSNQKFCSATGWKPKVSLSEGLRMQYQFLKRELN
ncbi:MAG: NAD-dependent epimerase/dehydratase family protein, partial [Candidatus Omnitrophota bacterium]|nr:NAD-dependent epimerase/dehydratase family protein [Candidatus Omnitrophota bacterium]